MQSEPNTHSGLSASEIDDLYKAINWANENGLLWEFLDFFLSDYDKNKNIHEAVNYANSEWDL